MFAQDDWTITEHRCSPGQASPRDNVVFEAGLFGGRSASAERSSSTRDGSKLPTDLLGLTSVRSSRAPQPRRSAQSPKSSARRSRPKVAAADRGAVVAALPHRAQRGRTDGGRASCASGVTGTGAWSVTGGAGRRTAPCRPATGARPRRAARTRLASSTTGGASDRATRTPRSSRAPGNQIGDDRPRHRLLVDPVRSRRQPACPNCWHLPPR